MFRYGSPLLFLNGSKEHANCKAIWLTTPDNPEVRIFIISTGKNMETEWVWDYGAEKYGSSSVLPPFNKSELNIQYEHTVASYCCEHCIINMIKYYC